MWTWCDARSEDAFDITRSVQIVLHKIRLLATYYPTPNHHAPTKSISFQHAAIRTTLVCAAINPSSAISMTKRKWVFVTEQNPVPVGSPPDEMTFSTLHPDKLVTSRHCLVFIRATRADGFVIFPQTVTVRLGRKPITSGTDCRRPKSVDVLAST